MGILRRPASPRNTGITLSSSSRTGKRVAPGLVDSPPTSRMSAPSLSSSSALSIARSGSKFWPPSENESGVIFNTPIIAVRVPSSIVLSPGSSSVKTFLIGGRLTARAYAAQPLTFDPGSHHHWRLKSFERTATQMLPTERLYFRDSRLLEFTGTVIDIRSSDGGDSVVLDRTAFYPTGGGQPNDLGTLSSVEVTDVFEDESGAIYHKVAGASSLAIG